ncbi:CBS domain-containing protein [Caballeronia terrestris]|uniref:CBS domain-containing protein n=1 Tax=Caballeronia terrestris TaxID=1226301 RepID=A0A158KX50_9BURK|nr:CBS domain-containing protein [Caballeronia terrestris]SAL85309.1 CBS domain-containing protein [Caballeronia terrestris]
MLVSKRMKPAIFLEPDETLAAAARKLRKDNIGCLPVCQDGRLLGIITDRDIAMRGVAEGRDANNMRVREAMSVDAICCSKDDSIETAAAVMRDAHVQRLAVVDDDGHLVGVISITDLEGGGSERRPFEVIFYKEILDHAGLPHHSELLCVSVAQGTKHEAVASAIVQFEETKRVANWTTIADGYDVLSIHVDENGESVEALEHTFERDARIRPRARILWEQAGNPERQDAKFWDQAAREVDDADRSAK